MYSYPSSYLVKLFTLKTTRIIIMIRNHSFLILIFISMTMSVKLILFLSLLCLRSSFSNRYQLVRQTMYYFFFKKHLNFFLIFFKQIFEIYQSRMQCESKNCFTSCSVKIVSRTKSFINLRSQFNRTLKKQGIFKSLT